MILNYLAIGLRNIRQNPMYAAINIFSLAVGIAACLVIYLFVRDEQSFDAFHSKRDAIYRLDEIQNFTGTNVQKVALSMPGMGPFISKEFPEVSNFTRIMNRTKQLVVKDERRILLPGLAIVDSTFLEIFDFDMLLGDPSVALDEPYSMCITEATALKFFSSVGEAMSNTLTFRDKEYKVTGVLKNIPENSHMQFDALASMTTITTDEPEFNNQWGSNFLNTYFILEPNADIKAMEEKFPAFMSRHMDNPEINDYYKLFLQRLDQVHLGSMDIEHDYNNYRKFNGEYLEIFYIIGVFILLIATVNFMNLTTARASHRWKEIGVRKTVGAKQIQLFAQFIFESALLALFSLGVAVLIDVLFLPVLNNLVGRQLSLWTFFDRGGHFLVLVLGTILLGVLAGIYPSLYLTSFNMTRMLKGGSKSEGKSVFRSGLVVIQFGLALAMIVSTLVVVQQLAFIRNKDIGFDKDQMMLIGMNREANQKFELLRTELKRSPLILGVTASGQRIGNNFHQWGFKVKADTTVVEITPSNVNVDYEYLTVYGIRIKEGRNFSKDFEGDNGKAFIINESLAKELALKEIVGTPAGHGWYPSDSLGTIIGVVNDFNFNSLHHKINTLEMVVHPDWGYDEMSVKIDGRHPQEAMSFIKGLWEQHVPSYPFDYSFLDEHFEVLYRSDRQMASVVAIMAGLAILISCVGLFGLAAITAARKTKEIGIRKVLGATEAQITLLLSRNFVLLIVLSFVVVSPITYWVLTLWLQSFAYRITINPMLFLAGGLLSLSIALFTISYHTIRSARTNPVNSLRYE